MFWPSANTFSKKFYVTLLNTHAGYFMKYFTITCKLNNDFVRLTNLRYFEGISNFRKVFQTVRQKNVKINMNDTAYEKFLVSFLDFPNTILTKPRFSRNACTADIYKFQHSTF